MKLLLISSVDRLFRSRSNPYRKIHLETIIFMRYNADNNEDFNDERFTYIHSFIFWSSGKDTNLTSIIGFRVRFLSQLRTSIFYSLAGFSQPFHISRIDRIYG